jgi:multiple antibiotic resistance protein
MDTGISILSTAILIMFVLDPFGNIPILLTILKDVEPRRRYWIIAREMLIGLAILLLFLFFGKNFLSIFHLETEAVTIAGGIIFFIIGLRLIFPGDKGANLYPSNEEPLIVPIAMPLVAGPSALATLIVLGDGNKDQIPELFIALMIAWGISFVILMASPLVFKVLRHKGLVALERLMGMLLLMLAVQMCIDGIRGISL